MAKKIVRSIRGLEAVSLASRVLKGRALLVAFAFMGASFGFFSLSAYIRQVERTHIIPYLVTVDSHGVVLAGGTLAPSPEVPMEVIAATLAGFIKDFRQISSDQMIQKQAILKVYSHVKDGSSSQQKLDAFYKKVNPFDEGQKKRIEVQIANVIAQQGQAMQIDWNERTITGGRSVDKKQRALVSYQIENITNPDAQKLLLNPLSIYVTDFEISEVITNV